MRHGNYDMTDDTKTCKLCGGEMKLIHFTSCDTFFNRCECGKCIIDNNHPYRNQVYRNVEIYGCPKCGMVMMSVESDD